MPEQQGIRVKIKVIGEHAAKRETQKFDPPSKIGSDIAEILLTQDQADQSQTDMPRQLKCRPENVRIGLLQSRRNQT